MLTKKLLFLVFFSLSLAACTGNVENSSIQYSRNPYTEHADITISFELEDIPDEIQILFFENILFFDLDDWPGTGMYKSSDFDFYLGDTTRFAFERVGTTNIFSLTRENALLKVDDWIQYGTCPYKKIQLSGFVELDNGEFQLPNVLEIPFPCTLEALNSPPVSDTPLDIYAARYWCDFVLQDTPSCSNGRPTRAVLQDIIGQMSCDDFYRFLDEYSSSHRVMELSPQEGGDGGNAYFFERLAVSGEPNFGILQSQVYEFCDR